MAIDCGSDRTHQRALEHVFVLCIGTNRMKQVDIASIIEACEQKCRRAGLAGLTAKERVVVLASWANFEIELGGVAAFFHNSTGTHAREIVKALIELGAMDEAAAINQGRELLRIHSWEELARSAQFERLTDKFLASMPGLVPRLASFVDLHREELEVSAERMFVVDAPTS